MTVPSVTWGERGFIAPSGPAVLAGVQGDIDAAFGRTLSYNLNTPQGQLATSEAALVVNFNSIFVYYTNQVDPAYATGRMQDAIARIYFLTRLPAEPTVLQIQCSGDLNTVIPEGASIVDGSGNIYLTTGATTIPSSGLVTVAFSAQIPGPTPVPDEVTIYQAVSGLDSVTVLSGVVGQATESRAQFEARRIQSVAKNARSVLDAVLGAVLEVSGVLDAYVTENDEPTIQVIGGYTLAANSLYVAAIGGSDEDVAAAILSKKSPGCVYNGNTEVTIESDNPAYSPPVPSYLVKFERPAALPILFDVQMTNNGQVPADAVTQVQDAIIAAFNGTDGGARARIGATVYASRYVTPVVLLGSWAQIQSMLVGSTNSSSASFQASIAGTVMTVGSVTAGALATGQTVIADRVADGTQIESQAGGSPGSVGTYNLSISQTVANRNMKSAVAASASQTVNIDQNPTISRENIAVTFA